MEEDLRNMMSKTVKSSIIQLVCRSVKENGRQFRKETEDKINMQKKSKERTSCDTCAFYVYDDEYGEYYCDMNMDEDGLYADHIGPVLPVSLLSEWG